MNNLTDALLQYMNSLNVIFIITFILVTWLVNTTIDAKNFATKLNFFQKIPKILRVLFLAMILGAIFILLGDYRSKDEIFALFLSVVTSMVIWKIGIDKIFKIIVGKLGIQID